MRTPAVQRQPGAIPGAGRAEGPRVSLETHLAEAGVAGGTGGARLVGLPGQWDAVRLQAESGLLWASGFWFEQ